jgi:hypothetical protein
MVMYLEKLTFHLKMSLNNLLLAHEVGYDSHYPNLILY